MSLRPPWLSSILSAVSAPSSSFDSTSINSYHICIPSVCVDISVVCVVRSFSCPLLRVGGAELICARLLGLRFWPCDVSILFCGLANCWTATLMRALALLLGILMEPFGGCGCCDGAGEVHSSAVCTKKECWSAFVAVIRRFGSMISIFSIKSRNFRKSIDEVVSLPAAFAPLTKIDSNVLRDCTF